MLHAPLLDAAGVLGLDAIRALVVSGRGGDEERYSEALATPGDPLRVTRVPPEDAVRALHTTQYDVVLVPVHIGLGMIAELKAEMAVPVFVLAEPGDTATPAEVRAADLAAMSAGASGFVVIGQSDPGSVVRALRYASHHARSARVGGSGLRYRAMMEAAADAILVVSHDSVVEEWNRAAQQLFALDRAQPGRLRLNDILVGPNTDTGSGQPSDAMDFVRLLANQPGRPPVELDARRLHGASFPVELSAAVFAGARGEQWTVITRDVSHRRAVEAQLAQHAFHDSLTGLANRSLFVNRVEHALARMSRRPDSIAVLFIDLDDFKPINDVHGHRAGDELLILVAGRLRSCVRPTDTVARLGGDEFAILVEETNDPRAAVLVAERLLTSLASSFSLSERTVSVAIGSSIGIAVATSADVGADELLRHADTAMYSAKHGGKNRFALYEDAMNAALVERMHLEDELRRAVAQDELLLHYQPIVDLLSGVVVGFEALIRWANPRRGLMQPALFVPIAEEIDLMPEIGAYVLDTACGELRQWQHACAREDLSVWVNLSGRELLRQDLPSTVQRTLNAHDLNPNRLVLEVAERVIVEQPRSITAPFEALRALGVRLAVDDVGTAVASLSYLHDLPVDILKLDRFCVRRVGELRGLALVRATTALGRHLGLTVVGEGLEFPEHTEALRAAGCHYGQGYLLGRPVPASAVPGLLARRPREWLAAARARSA